MFSGFYAMLFQEYNVWNCRDSAGTSLPTWPIPTWQIKYEVFGKFSEQFNKSEIFLWWLSLWNVLKTMTLLIFLFLKCKNAFFIISHVFHFQPPISMSFLCFPYYGKFAILILNRCSTYDIKQEKWKQDMILLQMAYPVNKLFCTTPSIHGGPNLYNNYKL